MPGDFFHLIAGSALSLSRYRVSLGSNVSVTANTTTAVMSQIVIMPSGGGPFRALIVYDGAIVNGTTNGANVALWVSDATNNFAEAYVGMLSSATIGTLGFEGSGISTVTYSNGASVTFTLEVNSTQNATIDAALPGGTGTPSLSTHMDILVFPSN